MKITSCVEMYNNRYGIESSSFVVYGKYGDAIGVIHYNPEPDTLTFTFYGDDAANIPEYCIAPIANALQMARRVVDMTNKIVKENFDALEADANREKEAKKEKGGE